MDKREYGRQWRAKNKEKIRVYLQKYRKTHRGEIIKWRKDFCRVNKDRLRIMDREVDFGGNWKKTLDRDNWICRHCGKDLTKYRPNVHHKDNKGHSIKKKKANNTLDNLISLCIGCHSTLHRRIENELRRRIS